MVIVGISESMSFTGNDGRTVSGYRVDTSEPYSDINAYGYRTDHGFITIDKMKPEYYEMAKAGTPVIALRSRTGKINGFIPA